VNQPTESDNIPAAPAGAEELPPPAAAEIAVGAQLRAAREAAGLGVVDVAQRLKFAARQIEALENSQFAALPGITFVRGFVRSYARLVGLNADVLVAALERQAGREPREVGPSTVQLQTITATPARFPTGSSGSSRWPWVVASVFAVVGLGGFILFQWQAPDSVKRQSEPPPAAEGPVTAPVVTASEPAPASMPDAAVSAGGNPAATSGAEVLPTPATAGAAASAVQPAAADDKADIKVDKPTEKGDKGAVAGSGKIHLVFSDQSWTEIRQAGGKVVFSQQNAAGSDAWVDGAPPFDFVIGNAKGVKLFYRGNPIDLTPYVKVSVARMQLK
jgi:cytoskeleton protein RodZ